MTNAQELDDARAEIRRLEAEIAVLRAEHESVADANVRAALHMVEVSEQRRVEAEERETHIQLALQIAESAARHRGEFLAKVSHELRTPLNGMIGMTTLLLDTQLSPAQREYAEISLAAANNLLDLIRDILDFSKLEASTLTLEATEFDLWNVAEDVVRILVPKCSSRGLSIQIDIDPRTPRRVIGDPTRLRQVLTNLVGNAVKFTDAGEVSLSLEARQTSADRTRLHVAVRDTGCGISPESFPRLFQAFSQVDNSLSRRHDGTGLGLVISDSLVRLMGGKIDVESELGQGSRFFFDVELATVAGPIGGVTLPRSVALATIDARTKAVLVSHLAALGVEVLTFDGLDALLAQRTAPTFDCLFVEADGGSRQHLSERLQLLRSSRASPTRIVVLSPIDCLEWVGAIPDVTVLALPIAPSRIFGCMTTRVAEERPQDSLLAAIENASNQHDARAIEVLLVEDNAVNRKVAARMLARLGCRVDLAVDGLEALECAADKRYDLILMDCQMPNLDGYEATRRLRERELKSGLPVRVPIIALTAQAMHGDRERCLAVGMDDYLSKPFEPAGLARVLERWGPDHLDAA